ncbi:MAG: ABC transporter substrate-binding protein [Nitrospirae bacterium]|nr:MAG: ABC transporter substrate-binding protein [Nitrospirota bacterium]
MKLRIGHLSTFYHTATILMDRAVGPHADAEWRLFGTGPAIVDALEKNGLDIAYIGLPPAIIGIQRGVPIKCVAGGHVEGTVMTGFNKYKGLPETDSLELILNQFKGGKIGVPGKGSIHDLILQDSLQKYGLRQAIEVVNYPWSDLTLEDLVKHRIEAAFGTPALAVAARRYADCKILYPPSKLWPDNPSYGILTTKSFLEAHRDIVIDFLKAHCLATELLLNDPRKAAALIAGNVGVIDEDFVFETLSVSPKYCARITEAYTNCTMKLMLAMKTLGYIEREIGADEIFDTSLIADIHGC